MERGVRRLLLKNVQLEQAGEVSYQALNAVTSAMLNVKGERSRSRTPHVVASCENKGAGCWGDGVIKMMPHLRSLFETFFSMSDTENPSSGVALCCVVFFVFVGPSIVDLFSGCLVSVVPPVVSF